MAADRGFDTEQHDTGPDILLVGNPNVGKSVVFGLLTGTYVVVSNYPGTTVEISEGKLRGIGPTRRIIDTPGVNDLNPVSMDEVVTRDILMRPGEKVVVQVIDATHLARGLQITSQLAEHGVPMVVCLNMLDEARRSGVDIDTRALAERLGVEVVPTVAVERRGISHLFQALPRARPANRVVQFRPDIEQSITAVADLLPSPNPSRRGQALTALTCDPEARRSLLAGLRPEDADRIEEIVLEAQGTLSGSLAYATARRRWEQVEALATDVTTRRTVSPTRLRECASAACMHPVWGTAILLAVLYVMYLLVGRFGAGTCVDYLQNTVFGRPERVLHSADGSQLQGELELTDGAAIWRSKGHAPLLRGGQGYILTARGHFASDSAAATRPRVSVTVQPIGAADSSPPLPPPPYSLTSGADGAFDVETWFTPNTAHAALIVRVEAPGARTVTLSELHLSSAARGLINPLATRAVNRILPWKLGRDVLVGEYGLITMGLTYAVAIVLPIVSFFFLFFGLLEDSGYLPRLTVVANRAFRLIGLNGKAVLPMVLGLGCATMATLSARILDSRKSQLITIILLALGVPCSAQLGVLMGMLGDIGWGALAVVFGIVGLQLIVVGSLANKLLPGERDDFIIEIPLVRMPQLWNVVRKTVQRVEWFLREAVPYFLLGTFVLFVLDRVGALRWIEAAGKPVVSGLLGLPPEAARAFLIGFLRRDYGAAGLFDLRLQGKMDGLQTVVAMVTITLFVPCLANFFIMVKERGAKTAIGITAFILPVAVLTGAAVNGIFHALGLANVFGP